MAQRRVLHPETAGCFMHAMMHAATNLPARTPFTYAQEHVFFVLIAKRCRNGLLQVVQMVFIQEQVYPIEVHKGLGCPVP